MPEEVSAVLRGENVYLTPLDVTNAEIARAWINDPDVNTWLLTGTIPLSREAELTFYAAAEENARLRTGFVFEIHLREDGRYVGNCGLEHVDLVHRNAEVGILIGDREDWGQGIGGDAIVTLLRFAFETLGLHAAQISVFEGNTRAHELYRRLGFTEGGRDREAFFARGAFHDHIRLDMLEDEFRERYGGATA